MNIDKILNIKLAQSNEGKISDYIKDLGLASDMELTNKTLRAALVSKFPNWTPEQVNKQIKYIQTRQLERNTAKSRRTAKTRATPNKGNKPKGNPMTRKQANYYFIRGYMEKKAQTAYGDKGSTLAFQQYLPLGKRREFTKDEEEEIANKSKRLFPKIWRSNQTPLTDLVASPGKSGLVAALSAPLAGAALGAAFDNDAIDNRALQAAIGAGAGLLASPILGALGYYSRRQQNENVAEHLRRLPVGATIRDMKSDPVYQREQSNLLQAAANNANRAALGGILGVSSMRY